jgi:hypothetical protein
VVVGVKIGVCRVGDVSAIYVFYSVEMCRWYGIMCRVYIIYSIYSYGTREVGCRAMYNIVSVEWELSGGRQRGWRLGHLCPRGLFGRIGDMRHRSS